MSKKIEEVRSLLAAILHLANHLRTSGLAVNHLDFELAVGSIETGEYNKGIT